MGDTKFDGIVFADTWQEISSLQYAGRVIHILCRKGNMGFTFQDTHYNISSGDYVILPNATLASDFSASDDFQGILMNLSEAFVTSIAIRSNYGIIGHLSLLRNPVMKLSKRDFRICEAALQYLRMRMEDETHFFREELLGSLLTAHILDLYDIHARSYKDLQVSECITSLLRSFIELLYNGEYVRNRDLEFYASRLCITQGKWKTCLLLDRPLHYAGNHPPAPAKRTLADGNRRTDEFLFRVLFQPICTKANQYVALGI